MITGDRIYHFKFWSLIIAVFLVFSHSTAEIFPQNHDKYFVYTQNCKIPELDPFNNDILPFYEKISNPYYCGNESFFFSVINGSSVDIDKTALKSENINVSNLICNYREIVSDKKDSWKMKKPIKFTLGSSIPKEYVKIECTDKTSKKVMKEYVSLVPDQPSPPENSYLNVIILGIDSTSALNFHRHFPRSMNFLSSVLNAKELYGYHKVNTNSFPNIFSFLTGHPSEDYWNEHNKSNVYFDDADLIWKHYKNEGYNTMYLEDMTNYGTFNWYKKLGFKKKPVDHYFRPMAIALENAPIKENKENCFKSKMEGEFYWDYLKMFSSYSKNPYFAFTFISRLVHGDSNNAGYLDVPLYNLMKDFFDRGVLNRSLLVIFSDHGLRVGNIRQTLSGYYEERMPVAFLAFPEWFYLKHPDALKHLNENANKLTTHYDIHATLLHLLELQSRKIKFHGKTQYGISLLSEIPSSRTCKDAGIIQHWCACGLRHKVHVTDSRVREATALVLRELNSQLKNTRCSQLSIQSVQSAYVSMEPNGTYLRVKIQPVGAVLEATILQGQVLRPISRLDTYGGSSGGCLPEGDSRFSYCHCPKS